MNRRARSIALIVAAMLVQGCILISHVSLGEPRAEGATSKHDSNVLDGAVSSLRGAHNDLFFDLPETTLYVRSFYLQETPILFGPFVLPIIPWVPSLVYLFRSHSKPPPPFEVELRFEPKGQTLSFDLARVTLRSGEGEPLEPIGGLPADRQIATLGWIRGEWWGCRSGRSARTDETARDLAPIEIREQTCVRLLFDVSPAPEQKLVLSLGGVASDGRALVVPRISFERASGWLILMAP